MSESSPFPFQFAYGRFSSDKTVSQGADGRRKENRRSPTILSGSYEGCEVGVSSRGPGRPTKRTRSQESEPAAPKRRRGRPRKDENDPRGATVEFGSFRVPGITRTHSLPVDIPIRGSGEEALEPIAVVPRRVESTGDLDRSSGSPLEVPPHGSSSNRTVQPLSQFQLPALRQEDPDRLIAEEDFDDNGPHGSPTDNEVEADGSGIGVCEDALENDEGDEDDPAAVYIEDLDGGPTTQPAAEKMAPWLQARFDALVNESRVRDEQGRPPLYSKNHTIHFPNPDPWFVLQESHDPAPSDLYGNAHFILWDPHALVKFIPCPNGCGHSLSRHSHIRRPRRIISLTSTYWIIGYRYTCSTCRSAKRPGQSASFQSWSSLVLKQLPDALAASFPAMLTYRSGIDIDAFNWMRSTFQYGLGSKQFSDALRVQHMLKYDRLQLSYLQHLKSRPLNWWLGKTFDPFPAFDDRTSNGPLGYVPSAKLLRNIYDCFIQKYEDIFSQAMALLSAEVCALDHSHKFTKFVMRVNGERIFTGLLTVTNERGEIRLCCLVATKSHAQFEKALLEMRESLHLYGLKQPEVFYTDNVQADRQFLMDIFPSLCEDVVPNEKYRHLPLFSIPSDVSISVRSTASSINTAVQAIMDDLPEDGSGSLAVGFDCEWNVRFGANERIIGREEVAIIQIAYKKCIYILQVSEHLKNHTLPHQLKLFLSNPHIVKVGRQVNADLVALRKGCEHPTPFRGGVELLKFARERCVLESRLSGSAVGLNDLCALILGKCLQKNSGVRVSSSWNAKDLSQTQIDYAAGDAWASLLIYHRLVSIPIPSPLPPDSSNPNSVPAPGTHVLVCGEDGAIIAKGCIASPQARPKFDRFPLRSQLVVEVHHVVVPGAVLMAHGKKPLSAFGPTPFNAIVSRLNVRVYQPVALHDIEPESGGVGSDKRQYQQRSQPSRELTSSRDIIPLAEALEEGPSLSDLIYDTVDTTPYGDLAQRADSSEVDRDAEQQGLDILGSTPVEWPNQIFSRVLKDPFHVFNMFYIAMGHGLRVEFSQALRDAIFIAYAEDRARIEAWAAQQNPPLSWDYLVKFRARWLWQRVRRLIPPREALYLAVEAVFKRYGPLKDAATLAPLFNKEAWRVAKQILKLIYDGYLSDPPGVALYTQMGIGRKTGLPIYRCFRGTNATEGGVHTHLRRHLPSSGTSIEHVQACLTDFVYCFNTRGSHRNNTGHPYRGHYDPWVTNEIQEHYLALRPILTSVPDPDFTWLNTNFYQRSSEVIGILPIPADIRDECGILPYDPTAPVLNTKAHRRYAYLARRQNTRKAVLPVSTPEERQLFKYLMQNDPSFGRSHSGEPNYPVAVKVWNTYAASRDDIPYKLVEHLQSYYSAWLKSVNIKETKSLTLDARRDVDTAVRSTERAKGAPQIAAKPLRPHLVSQGFKTPATPGCTTGSSSVATPSGTRPEQATSLSAPSLPVQGDSSVVATPVPANPISASNSRSSNSSVSSESDYPQSRTTPPPPRLSAMTGLAQQHVSKANPSSDTRPKRQKRRRCMKCLDNESCGGRQQWENCKRPCFDCGKHDCLGRDSKHPKKKCWEVKDIMEEKRRLKGIKKLFK